MVINYLRMVDADADDFRRAAGFNTVYELRKRSLLEAVDGNGRGALHYAVCGGAYEAVAWLLFGIAIQ